MKKYILILLAFLCSLSLKLSAQTAYDETTPINQLPTGIFYQPGPGDSNTLNWTYPYSVKFTINSSVARNFEFSTIGKNNDGYMIRQFSDQTNQWTGWKKFILDNGSGLVGIGISTPFAGLHVVNVNNYNGNRIAAILGNQYNDWTYFGGLTGGRIRGSTEGYLVVGSNPDGTGDKSLYLNFDSPGNVIVANGGGNVGIGTTSPQYKLDVIGTIRAREIKVDLNGADFVFGNSYKLRTLSNLDQYIRENKHLPGIESANKMEADGTDLGALNTKLLQKIEELTLYIIKQDKKSDKLMERVKALEFENKAISEKINRLETNK